ncbi:MAG: PqqD family peptide modification chaperone [Candidatus Aenigmarchaeota archaeon]|nr:PqqD family peptide modification chaperone [Candidatus Aenigmarchaeota archaeon]
MGNIHAGGFWDTLIYIQVSTYFQVDGGVNIKLKKKGSLAKSQQGDLLLVDENKKAYKVDEVVVLIWTMCDGKHDGKEIVKEFCLRIGDKAPKEEIEKAVLDITQKLEKLDLIEKAGAAKKEAKKPKKPAKKKKKR